MNLWRCCAALTRRRGPEISATSAGSGSYPTIGSNPTAGFADLIWHVPCTRLGNSAKTMSELQRYGWSRLGSNQPDALQTRQQRRPPRSSSTEQEIEEAIVNALTPTGERLVPWPPIRESRARRLLGENRGVMAAVPERPDLSGQALGHALHLRRRTSGTPSWRHGPHSRAGSGRFEWSHDDRYPWLIPDVARTCIRLAAFWLHLRLIAVNRC